MGVNHEKSPFSPEADESFRKLNNIAQSAGIGGFMESFWQGTESIIRSEKAYRKAQRAKLLKKPKIREEQLMKEETHHEKSIVLIKRALTRLKEEHRELEAERRIKQMDEVVKNPTKFKKIQQTSLKKFFEGLLETELDPDMSREVTDIFEDVYRNVVKDRGIIDILDYIKVQLEELQEIRVKKKNRGRDERHSVLLQYKFALLCILGGVSLFVVIYCYYYDPNTAGCLDTLTACDLHVIYEILRYC